MSVAGWFLIKLQEGFLAVSEKYLMRIFLNTCEFLNFFNISVILDCKRKVQTKQIMINFHKLNYYAKH